MLFRSGCSNFNQDISAWDVSNVTSMGGMFESASLFNQDISSWDVSNVTSMSAMFSMATNFNNGGSPNISGWTTSSLNDISNMFRGFVGYPGYHSFNQPIGSWDVSNVSSMNSMFYNSSSFNQDLSGWCVTLIPSTPVNFDTGASSWVLSRPVWGTCPP